MKKSNLQKLAEIISFLNVPFSVVDEVVGKSYVLACSEEQYIKLSKVLLFYCTEFKIQPTEPVDDHFDRIYIVIPFLNILS